MLTYVLNLKLLVYSPLSYYQYLEVVNQRTIHVLHSLIPVADSRGRGEGEAAIAL